MRFEYEISLEDYVSASALYYKLQHGRRYLDRGTIVCLLMGILLIAVAWHDWALDWERILLGAGGVLWIYWGMVRIFPQRYWRRYFASDPSGDCKYQANVDANGFEITSDLRDWRVRWPAVQLKGENKNLFLFYSAGTMFIFAKRYLTDEQQQELRDFSALPAV